MRSLRQLLKDNDYQMVKVVVILLLLWLNLPLPGLEGRTGVDASWVYGLNAAAGADLLFGRDLIFTFGPLGYLMCSYALFPCWSALLAYFVIWLSWALLLFYIFPKIPLHHLVLFGVLSLFTMIGQETACVALMIGIGCMVVKGDDREALVFSCFGCVLGLFLLCTKFSTGVAGLMALGSAMLARSCAERSWLLEMWLPVICTGILFGLVLAYWQFGGLGAMINWGVGALEVSSGYSSAMSVVGKRSDLLWGMLSIGVLLLVAAFNFRKREDRYLILISILPIFVYFKHGYVRQDGHVMSFFSTLLLAMCVIGLFTKSRSAFLRVLALTVLIAGLNVVVGDGLGITSVSRHKILGKRSLAKLKSLSHYPSYVADSRSHAVKNLEEELIGKKDLGDLIKKGDTVDVIPFCTTVVAANQFEWKPAPVFQHYSAYNAALDTLNAEHYDGEGAADCIVAQFMAFDNRNMILDSPQAWRSICANYELSCELDDIDALLLLKRAQKEPCQLTEMGRTEFTPDTWIPVPFSNERLYARIPLDYSLTGKMRKTIYRIDPIFIEVVYSDGNRTTWRLTPEVCQNGILINYIPDTLDALQELLRGRARRYAMAFRLTGDGLCSMPFPQEISWFTDGVEVTCPDLSVEYSAVNYPRQTGDVIDGKVVAREGVNNEGFIAFGHYFFLPPGEYVATYLQQGAPKADIVADQGRHTLAEQQIPANSDLRSYEMPFSVKEVQEAVECRLYYNGRDSLEFHGLSIRPIQ